MGTFTPNTVASGNIIYASDHNTLGTLIAGVLNGGIDSTNLSDNAVSTAKLANKAATMAKIDNPYTFSAYRTTIQNINTTANKVLFNNENFDYNSNFDTTNNRYTAPVEGEYHFDANITTTTAGTGTSVFLLLYKNGSPVVTGVRNEASAGQAPAATVSTTIHLAAGDYVEVFGLAGTAAKALDTSSNYLNTFSGYLVNQT